jgi:anti-anti-sigma factor
MIDQVSIIAAFGREELILRLGGELDIATVETCRRDLTDAIDERRGRPCPAGSLTVVVLDLSELMFLSACGLRMLTDLAERLARLHITTVVVVRPNGIICRLVHLVGRDRQLTIVGARSSRTPASSSPFGGRRPFDNHCGVIDRTTEAVPSVT